MAAPNIAPHKVIAVASLKGGAGKTTISLLLGQGFGGHQVPAWVWTTDIDDEVPEGMDGRYCLWEDGRDGRLASGLRNLVDVRGVSIIDGGANREELDRLFVQLADLVIIPTMMTRKDIHKTALYVQRFTAPDLPRQPEILVLPNAWTDDEHGAERLRILREALGDHAHRVLSPVMRMKAAGELDEDSVSYNYRVSRAGKEIASQVVGRMGWNFLDLRPPKERKRRGATADAKPEAGGEYVDPNGFRQQALGLT